MAYVERKLGLLVKLNPKQAMLTIKVALKAHGTQAKAAVALGVSRRSLIRWMKQLAVAA